MSASNVETPDHVWAAQLWPEGLRFAEALGIPRDDEPILNHQVVPRTYAGLRDFAFICKNPRQRDHTRGILLTYRHPHMYANTPKGIICPVGIRVQGFIERCNLKPIGSWSPDKTPQSAFQHIVLSGGKEHGNIFFHYKTAVNDVVKFIHRELDVPPPTHRGEDDPEKMFVRRRVFTKVDVSNRRKASALEPGDDPMEYCKAIDREWRVMSKVAVGMYVPDEIEESEGDKVPCDPMVVSEGDFVDVCVGFDIVTRRSKDNKLVVQVHLNIEHVLVLVPAVEADEQEGTMEPAFFQAPGIIF
ncbi:hypothetical protein C8R43DRAFT_949466 [Mycena crocata]|nr:hypothetical protein C8R43DRAFT_949466 [Mycena crocata]